MSFDKALAAKRLIARRYEALGYAVTIQPDAEMIPFSLGTYRPGLLARNSTENVIVEVKVSGRSTDSEFMLRVNEEVTRHSGWKLSFVTVRDDDLRDDGSSGSGVVTVQGIQTRLGDIDRLGITPETVAFLVPVLWTPLMYLLRAWLSADGERVGGFSDFSLINRAYSSGYISLDQYHTLKRLLVLRNDELHGLESQATMADCQAIREMADTLWAEMANDDTTGIALDQGMARSIN